jgi:hypothetical protein
MHQHWHHREDSERHQPIRDVWQKRWNECLSDQMIKSNRMTYKHKLKKTARYVRPAGTGVPLGPDGARTAMARQGSPLKIVPTRLRLGCRAGGTRKRTPRGLNLKRSQVASPPLRRERTQKTSPAKTRRSHPRPGAGALRPAGSRRLEDPSRPGRLLLCQEPPHTWGRCGSAPAYLGRS